jgi:hypothetical protein
MACESAMQLHCRAGCPCSGDRPKLNSSSQGPKATQVCNRKAQCPKGMQQHRSTLEAQTCTTKRQLQVRGAGREHQRGDQAKGAPKVYKEPPKNLHSATSAQINQPMSWKQVTMSPGAKTCNGRAAVSRAARNNAPAAKPCPKCSNHATTRQHSASSARKTSPDQPAQHNKIQQHSKEGAIGQAKQGAKSKGKHLSVQA